MSKCIIGLATRDVAVHLKKIFLNINSLSTIFDKTIVCFSYDESKDSTLNMLYNYKNKSKNECEIIINKKPLLKYRTHRIAKARNEIINFINDKHKDADYFIMMDSDDLCSSSINLNVLKKYLNQDNWDSLSFNRSGLKYGNYDIWALQYEPFIHHCHAYNGKLNLVHLIRKDITNKLNSLKDNELFTCYSAFNGFAIYRTHKFLNCRYDGERQRNFSEERVQNMLNMLKAKYKINLKVNYDTVDMSHGGGKQNCEHIAFHIDAIRKNNARIRIAKEKIYNIL